ncbi:ABC transporter substrate-binding protein [Paenibacillus sp. y28]
MKKQNGFRFSGKLVLAAVLMGTAVLSGCASGKQAEPAANGTGTTEKKLTAVKQVTNWYAQPEHGGNYAADLKGFYKEAGLDMTIQSGGPGVSATQIVASGMAQFGMGQMDELLLARQNGIPLVAVLGTFQKSPQSLLFHKGENIKNAGDLNGRKVYVASGASYWEYYKHKYDLSKTTELKYTGDLSSFINDKSAVVQSYITSEPYVLKQKGIETEYLLNADQGYTLYGNVMFTTEAYIKDHPQEVKAFVEATVKGWDYFKDHSSEINTYIKEKNPDNPMDVMEYGAKALQPLVYEGDAATHGVGYMSKERWEQLNKQLVEIGLLKAPQDVSKVFTTEFLPKK